MKHYLDRNKDVSKKVVFNIKEKDPGERARLAKIFNRRGLDQETETLLHTYSARWESRPEDFWKPPSQSAGSLPSTGFEANMVGSYILARHDDA